MLWWQVSSQGSFHRFHAHVGTRMLAVMGCSQLQGQKDVQSSYEGTALPTYTLLHTARPADENWFLIRRWRRTLLTGLEH